MAGWQVFVFCSRPIFQSEDGKAPGEDWAQEPPQEGGITKQIHLSFATKQGGWRASPSSGLSLWTTYVILPSCPEGLPDSVRLSPSAVDSPSASHAHFSGDRPAFSPPTNPAPSWKDLQFDCHHGNSDFWHMNVGKVFFAKSFLTA